jgi:hypothetical protein
MAAVSVPIVAEFDGSALKRAQTEFQAFGNTMQRALSTAAKDARKGLSDVELGLNSDATAAQRLAAQLQRTSAQMASTFTQTTQAAESLGQALGPELAAKLGSNGLNRLVAQLQTAGLTLEQITTEADVLAQGIQSVDETSLQTLVGEAESTTQAFEQVSQSVDKSNRVVGRFAGAASRNLLMLGGSFGPLNMAIGQFAMFATRGDLTLSGFASSIGPIVAIGAALQVATSAIKAHKAEVKLNTEYQKDFTKSILAGKDALDVLADGVRSTGELKGFDPSKGLFGGVTNLIPTLDTLGIKYRDVKDAIEGGIPDIHKWADAARAAIPMDALKGTFTKEQKEQIDRITAAERFLVSTSKDLDKAQTGAAQTMRFFATPGMEATTALDGFANVARAAANDVNTFSNAGTVGSNIMTAFTSNVGDAAKIAGDFAAKTAAADLALREFSKTLHGMTDPQFKATELQIRAKQALVEYEKAQSIANKSHKSSDLDNATLSWQSYVSTLEDAAGAVSDVNGKLAGQQTLLSAAGNKKLSPGQSALLTNLAGVAGSPLPTGSRFGQSGGLGMISPNLAGVRPSSISAATQTTNNLTSIDNRSNISYSITVNGALDPAAVAAQLRRLLADDQARRSLASSIHP